ncbi:hypothetical protein BD779DRAFT_1782218 [Infundibulicybe gibba]|nr:hypothetical protein BD779DRAFT_1782218 [Infundibulicybe gibba]
MANTLVDENGRYYSCSCLNIRIRPARTETAPPDPATEADYIHVFVGEEGIIVAHPQVTLRIRTRGIPIAGTSRCSRFTAVTCLLCDTLVYRVHQIIPVDVEGKDGPVLPTEDWVEHEIMKSSSGWIQVRKGCLAGNAVTEAQSSTEYSQTFSLVVPLPTSPPSSPALEIDKPPSRPASPPVSPKSYLSNLRPLFPPAPFTPSHPVFFHLSTLAIGESDALRSAAEQHIANIVKEKVAEIEQAEAQLVQQVHTLWKRFRKSIQKIESQRRQSITRSPARLNDGEHWTVGTPTPGTPVAVRDFVPATVPPARASPASVPKPSALSASIATSGFHHPKALTSPAISPPRRHSLTYSETSTLVRSPLGEGSTVLHLPRSTNDAMNTTASYRYFLNLEEDMARHKREQQKKTPNPPAPDVVPATGSSQILPNANGKTSHAKQSASCSSDESSAVTKNKQPESEVSPRGRESVKGKRKVTFDVQPAVVTIKREVNAEQEEEALLANQDTGEMIFDLEDEGSDRSFTSQAVLPLIEQPSLSRPARARKNNPQLANGLPESFSRLRPSSLPAPSHIRPPRGQHGTDSSTQPLLSFPKPPTGPKEAATQPEPVSLAQDHMTMDPRDAEILRLVAADTPSHRGAWKPDSKAWQTFVRRQDIKGSAKSGNIPEEGEDDTGDSLGLGPTEMKNDRNYNSYAHRNGNDEEYNAAIGSLPIPINVLLQPRETLSLASYQPKTSLADRPGILVPALPTKSASSVALRKAAYAERDRTRSMDPGALDFAGEEYDEEEEEDDADNGPTVGETLDSGGRGRKQALKILQARSELPEEGMWRSLAS